MEEKLETITEAAEVTEEIFFEPYQDSDYIAAAFSALSAISDIDAGMMSKTSVAKINRIRRQSLRIISHCINNMYDELFEDSSDSNDD